MGLEEARGVGAFSKKEIGAVNSCIAHSRGVHITRDYAEIFIRLSRPPRRETVKYTRLIYILPVSLFATSYSECLNSS